MRRIRFSLVHRPDFANEPLTNLVAIGAVTRDSARLWVRSEEPGCLHAEWHGDTGDAGHADTEILPHAENDNTATFDLPSLRPGTRYRYEVTHEGGASIGAGSFETAPGSMAATPSHFSIAMASCHQPFDEQGAVQPEANAMLRAMRKCLEEKNTRMFFLMGDQMYSDNPKALSLFDDDFFQKVAPPGRKRLVDCTTAETRALYQRRYRHFWNLEDLKAIQAELPCYLIWDDHDIVDNWGSDPAHQSEPWLSVGEGARHACWDYQASRVLTQAGTSFHYEVEYGCTATFVMDLRSERRAGSNGRLFSPEQKQALDQFLARQVEKPVLFLVLSVPAVHLPQWLSRLMATLCPGVEDFSDRWSSGNHAADRDELFRTLRAHQKQHPDQRIVLLSGDIHIGCAHIIEWDDDVPPVHQFISSGITHPASGAVAFISKLIIRAHRRFRTDEPGLTASFRLLRGESGGKNPYGGMNLGLIEIETGRDGRSADLRYCIYGHEKGEPVCVFRSDPIHAGPA